MSPTYVRAGIVRILIAIGEASRLHMAWAKKVVAIV